MYDCQNIIVGGDFNLTFNEAGVRNRLRSTQEKRIAKIVEEAVNDAGLNSVWKDRLDFTWKRANTDSFSCIDHVFYNQDQFTLTMVKSNWALSYSDHAAVEATFRSKTAENVEKTRITRLDPSLIKDPETKIKFENLFNEMWLKAGRDWNPHLKLEYAKMCIRTVGEQLQAERKRREKNEEEELNEELNLAISKLGKGCQNDRVKTTLINYVEELRAKKDVIIEKKGERLAEKIGSKWYNEGEKSTRYFLRLLNRRTPDKFGELINSQNKTLKRAEEIEDEIVNFYKELYENYDRKNLSDTDDDQDFFNNLNPISGPDAQEVTQPITVEELAATLQTCADSAPGPDGIPYSFLGALWSTMGGIICEAWNYSLRVGKLCESHKMSFLRLIPKAGKDPKKLTNWRPITLSNCDHKLITKTYASRMAKRVSAVIETRQTAYLKGRLINDNIRGLALSLHLSNLDQESIDGLVVSLDAKKAFDSVEHSYIEKCLEKFGLGNFIPIFRVLYSELKSDILVNGKVVSGYKIKRGVKQGDALSCILFIMCMEPLIANIENNANIEKIDSLTLGAPLPKAYTYADDLNCTIKRTELGLQAVFDEYGRLTRLAGLELNADKTEIMRFANELKKKTLKSNFLELAILGKTMRLNQFMKRKSMEFFSSRTNQRCEPGTSSM